MVQCGGRDGLAVLINVNNDIRRVCGDCGDFGDDSLRTLVVFMGNYFLYQCDTGIPDRIHTYDEVMRR